jgi:hypothetical protein
MKQIQNKMYQHESKRESSSIARIRTCISNQDRKKFNSVNTHNVTTQAIHVRKAWSNMK